MIAPLLNQRKGIGMSQHDTLNDLFLQCYPALIAWAKRHVPAYVGEPEDLVHLAYIRCCKRWVSGRGCQGREPAYLFRALRWVAMDAWRRHSRRNRGLREAFWQRADSAHQPLGRLVFEEALASLTGRQHQVCRRLMAGKTETQICRELNLSRGALAVYVYRAKHHLCRYLEVSYPTSIT